MALGLAGLAVAGCNKSLNAPDVKNACYHVAPQKDGTIKFFKVADNDKSMYYCATQLDGIRYQFKALGSNRDSITGLYNGTYLFIDSRGVATAPDYEAGRFFAINRDENGNLVVPGGIPQSGAEGGAITITQNPMDQRNVKGSRAAKK
jgi:hypothetical protein